ncbi:MAG: hypothetical protein FJ020_07945 [Chloroflexi bacterium]|nr:hypothetical protein [Chloroflexota bacterium]
MNKAAKAGPVSGLVVFFLGIVLLLVTFVFALLAFLNPERIEAFTDLIPASEGEFEGAIKAMGYIVAVALLWVMGSLGGRIVGHGIQMFKSRPSSESDGGA